MICKTVFQRGRKLDDVSDNDVKSALKRGAGITLDLPDGLQFIEHVKAVTRMDAAEPVSERVLKVEIGLTKCLIGNEWMASVCPRGVWVPKFGKTAVDAVLNGMYPKEFREEVSSKWRVEKLCHLCCSR